MRQPNGPAIIKDLITTTLIIKSRNTGEDRLASVGGKRILDPGAITNARGQEMTLPFWPRIFGATPNLMFNHGVVAAPAKLPEAASSAAVTPYKQ